MTAAVADQDPRRAGDAHDHDDDHDDDHEHDHERRDGKAKGAIQARPLGAARRTELRLRALERWEADADGAAASLPAAVQERVQRVIDRHRGQPWRFARSTGEVGRPRVVVADADPADRVLLLQALRRDGRTYVAGDALDGAEALALVLIEQPDVLVLDQRLGTIAGEPVVDLLADLAPETRCVLLLGPGSGRVTARARPGIVRFRRSPGDRRALVHVIAHTAGGGQAVR
ncbi:MAG TPA: hypothetical protein VIL36_16665 [Acidimicrobiales bacterium]